MVFAPSSLILTNYFLPLNEALCVKEIMEFNNNLGVYVCSHIFEKKSPILLSVRDEDGWQFLCGNEGCPENSQPRLIGVGHLIHRDPSISELVNLKLNSFAQKIHSNAEWEFGDLE